MLGDLVTVARNRVRGAAGPGESSYAARPVSPIDDVITRYHISLEVADVTGVLASIATCFAEHDVSIQTVRQHGRGSDAQLVIVTHRARDAALTATVRALRTLPAVREVTSVMRVEGETIRARRLARSGDRQGVDRPVPDPGCRSPRPTPVITLGEGSTPLVPARGAVRASSAARSG